MIIFGHIKTLHQSRIEFHAKKLIDPAQENHKSWIKFQGIYGSEPQFLQILKVAIERTSLEDLARSPSSDVVMKNIRRGFQGCTREDIEEFVGNQYQKLGRKILIFRERKL